VKKIYFIIAFLGFSSLICGQESVTTIFDDDLPREHEKEFQFYAFFISQGVSSNFYPENIFMKGQVIGRLFGDNTTKTTDSLNSRYFEQRLLPFFVYQPKLFNGKALLRASFEIDFTWGDASYGAGGNLGSAISSDFVNLQTQNIELELKPAKYWRINLGLQRLFDTPYNPYRTFFDKMLQTGYRLSFWGTDAVGISVRRDVDFSNLKFGFYQLYENSVQEDDDVILGEIMYQKTLTPLWKSGGSLYYIRDRASGEGGVSIYAQGLNSKLNGYNGTFRFNFGSSDYRADIAWLGAFISRNEDFMMDRYRFTAFANYNIGTVDINVNDNWQKGADIGGLAANARFAYRYGQTEKDFISIDGIYATGDKNALDDKKYSGVITGNTWGAPAGIFIGTGSYLLFPHGNVVNRFTPAIADLSNMGYGLTALTANASKDFIPNKFNTKIGAAFANSNIKPEGGTKHMGTEFNTALTYTLGPFMSLELHGAYLMLGDFYKSNDSKYSFDINGGGANSGKPDNPWTAFVVFKWLMF
jgi:hypothetical protein